MMSNFTIYRVVSIFSIVCMFLYTLLTFNFDPMQIPSVILAIFFMIIIALVSDISTIQPNTPRFLMKMVLGLSVFVVGLSYVNVFHPIYLSSILFCCVTINNILLTVIESIRPQVLIGD